MAEPQETPVEEETNEESKPELEQSEQQPSDGTGGIRTILIPIPGGTVRQARQQQQPPGPAQAPVAGPPQQQQGPGLRNLVRFLHNPEGAMASNSSAYLRTMYSTDQADLVMKSAMNSSGYY